MQQPSDVQMQLQGIHAVMYPATVPASRGVRRRAARSCVEPSREGCLACAPVWRNAVALFSPRVIAGNSSGGARRSSLVLPSRSVAAVVLREVRIPRICDAQVDFSRQVWSANCVCWRRPCRAALSMTPSTLHAARLGGARVCPRSSAKAAHGAPHRASKFSVLPSKHGGKHRLGVRR